MILLNSQIENAKPSLSLGQRYIVIFDFVSDMPTRREVLSPLTTPNIRGHAATPKSNVVLSPSTSRHGSLQNITPLLTTEHDDEKERKERRRSKIVELQRRNLGSPSSPADRYIYMYIYICVNTAMHPPVTAQYISFPTSSGNKVGTEK